jgi:predicted permease
MLNDFRLAFRTFLRAPGFAAVAILSLALGIGANTAIFSLLDQALLRSLPIADPARLVVFKSDGPNPGWSSSDNNQTVFSVAMYRDLRDRSKVFTGVIARAHAEASVQAGGQTELAQAETVSGNFFEVLGLKPALGRVFSPQEDAQPGSGPVIVLENGFWVRRFGSDSSIVGKTVRVNNHPMTVIGVLPAGFRGLVQGNATDFFVPLSMKLEMSPGWPSKGFTDRGIHWLNVFGRLAPGVSSKAAEAAMQSVYRPILADEFAAMKAHSPRFRTEFLAKRLDLLPAAQGINQLKESWGAPLTVLMALVGLVLLIACANVANLLIARAAGRRREIAIRLAIGAGRGRLLRQLLAESLTLSLAGGLLGIVIAAWTVALLLRLLPSDNAGSFGGSPVDVRLLAFNFALSVVTGILFGLVPALQASSTKVSAALKDQSASVTTGGGQSLFRRTLVVTQVALSLLLLVASGLFIRSLANLLRHDPGFRVENLITFSMSPGLGGYSGERTVAFVDELRRRAAALPGVVNVTASSIGAFTGADASKNVTVEGYRAREDEDTDVGVDPVTPNYFATMGIRMLSGREFREGDGTKATQVVVVNQEFARHFLHGENPVGRHMNFGAGNDVKLDREIVGVVPDTQNQSLREKVKRFVYLPFAQEDRDLGEVHFYVRASRNAESLETALRGLARRMDASLPVTGMETMETRIADTVYTDRMVAALSSAFGFLATLLAAIGLYGLLAYTVARRTAEIGIRIALGASRSNVVGLVMREVVVLCGIGVLIGICVAFALASSVESQLFGLNGRDPLVFAVATFALVGVALLSGYIPASRAARIDPIRALRYE